MLLRNVLWIRKLALKDLEKTGWVQSSDQIDVNVVSEQQDVRILNGKLEFE